MHPYLPDERDGPMTPPKNWNGMPISLDRPVLIGKLPKDIRADVKSCSQCFDDYDHRWILCSSHRVQIHDMEPEVYR